MSEPNILLDSWSPVCDIQAFVEETDRNCYFYLWFYPNSERSYIRECWICNTAPAEDKIDMKVMGAAGRLLCRLNLLPDKANILKIHVLSDDRKMNLEYPLFDSEIPVTPVYIKHLLDDYF